MISFTVLHSVLSMLSPTETLFMKKLFSSQSKQFLLRLAMLLLSAASFTVHNIDGTRPSLDALSASVTKADENELAVTDYLSYLAGGLAGSASIAKETLEIGGQAIAKRGGNIQAWKALFSKVGPLPPHLYLDEVKERTKGKSLVLATSLGIATHLVWPGDKRLFDFLHFANAAFGAWTGLALEDLQAREEEGLDSEKSETRVLSTIKLACGNLLLMAIVNAALKIIYKDPNTPLKYALSKALNDTIKHTAGFTTALKSYQLGSGFFEKAVQLAHVALPPRAHHAQT